MRRVPLCVFLVCLGACARPRPPAVSPEPGPAIQLAAADSLVRAGCLECLVSAYHAYDALRSTPSAADAATAGAIRAAALVALRQHELGMVDEGYLTLARDLTAGHPSLPAFLPQVLDVIDALPSASIGAGHPTSDADLTKMDTLRTNRAAWAVMLRDAAGVDEAAAYTWLSFMCTATEARAMTREELFAPVSTFSDTALIVYRQATCRGVVEPQRLQALAAAEPRFGEVSYFLGLLEVGRRKLDAADDWFLKAYAWHPRWPALTMTMANDAMTAEEFESALTLYEATLGYEPHAVDALLGKVRALTYLGRNAHAIETVDTLLTERWYLGDARYWRALNEAQLEQYDEAWADVELAAKLLVNPEVPKLAGIIAYRRGQLDVSRAKFEESRRRNRDDCEAAFYLGVVLAEQRVWELSASTLVETALCLAHGDDALEREIATIEASTDPPERKAKQIARREQQIAAGRRMRATSWFNTAVAYFSLSRAADAREYAQKVVDDTQFGERAREILSRLK
jgi:tetratricopeptide (TPR) repeat protein